MILKEDKTYLYVGNGKAIVKMQNGINLMLPMQDPFIGCQLALNREIEIDDAIIEKTIKKEIHNKALCINVGANIGYFSLLLARICAQGKIFIFEPNPKNVEMLIFNFNLNQLNSVPYIYRAAVSDDVGTVNFLVHDKYSDGWIVKDSDINVSKISYDENGLFHWDNESIRESSRILKVPVVTLDGILGSSGIFDLILSDAEGFDCNVILGAKEIIHKSPNLKIIFEWNSKFYFDNFDNDNLEKVFRFLKKENYQTFYSLNNKWVLFDFDNKKIPLPKTNIFCKKIQKRKLI
jgi:FkbM family methyltransferase